MTERTSKKPKILCAGIAVQDIIMRVQNFPAPGTKVSASEFIVTGGGCAANAAVAIARLDGRVAFAGPLGGSDETSAIELFPILKRSASIAAESRALTEGQRRCR